MGYTSAPHWGYVEVKAAAEEHNKYRVSKDLIRLGMLTKNSPDVSVLKGCMAIQIISKFFSCLYRKTMYRGIETSIYIYISF